MDSAMAAEVTLLAHLCRTAMLAVLAVPTPAALLPIAHLRLLRSPSRLPAATARSSSSGNIMFPSFGMLLTALSFLAFGTFLFLVVQQAVNGADGGGRGRETGRGSGGPLSADQSSWPELAFLLHSVDGVPEMMAEAVLKTTRVLTSGRSMCRARRLCQLNSRAQRRQVYEGLIFNAIR